MKVSYRELSFKSEEERDKAVRYILENAEISLPGTRVVRVGADTFRVSLNMLKGQYFLVYKPRAKELMPRIWLITIPGFRLCELPIGKDMVPCNGRVTSVAVDGDELIYVCDYHGSGFKAFKGLMERQLKPVPPSLCARYCPSAIKSGHRIVTRKRVKDDKIAEYEIEVAVYECRAFMSYRDEEEERKRRRSYKGMFMLCVEDWWWRRYLRRHEFEQRS